MLKVLKLMKRMDMTSAHNNGNDIIEDLPTHLDLQNC